MADRLRRAYRFSTVPEHLTYDEALSDRAFRLWCILDRYAGANGEAFPLRQTLADRLRCSLASIDRALAELVDHGWLSKERRVAGGSNDYTLLIAKVPPLAAKRAKKEGPSVTGEARGRVTGDDTHDSQVTRPVVTGDAHKEEPVSENHLTESSADTSAAPEDKPLATRIAEGWWEHYQAHFGPIVRTGRSNPFIALRDNLIAPALEAGWTETEVKRALLGPQGQTPDPIPAKPLFQRRLSEARSGTLGSSKSRPIENRHHVSADSPDRAARIAAMNGDDLPPEMRATS